MPLYIFIHTNCSYDYVNIHTYTASTTDGAGRMHMHAFIPYP